MSRGGFRGGGWVAQGVGDGYPGTEIVLRVGGGVYSEGGGWFSEAKSRMMEGGFEMVGRKTGLENAYTRKKSLTI